MKHHVSIDDLALVRRFESGEMQPNEFHHREHIRLAYIYSTQAGFDQALENLRRALQSFLRFHGINSSKYHETMTRAWLLAVMYFKDRAPPMSSSLEFLESQPTLLDQNIMATHYSHELLASQEARLDFVAPDRAPIPPYL